MLSLSHVDSFYGRSQALHDLSVTAETGRIIAILGRNGVGKTTLLRTILGLTDRSDGKIELDGQEISGLATYARARAGIAYVPQGRMIIPDFTIRDNILMGGFAAGGVRRIPDIVPELFPYLMDNLDRPGGVLSGGQQQQLAIGRALVTRPKLLLLDEPTEGIQPSIIKDIGRAIRFLRDSEGITVLLVEQYLDFCRDLADDIYIMDRGEIVHAGDAASLDRKDVRKHLTV